MKPAESEFDELLGQLTNELAMTPASTSGIALVPDLDPPKIVEVASRKPAEAAAEASASKPDNAIVKVVGIIAASLTIVSVAALIVLGGSDPKPELAAADPIETSERDVAAAAAQLRAEQEAHTRAIQAERQADRAEYARVEAKRLTALSAAQTDNHSKPRKKPKKPKTEVGGDFDEL